MRRLAALVGVGILFFGIVGQAGASRPRVVLLDAIGDAGNQDSALPQFDTAGFDIVKGTVARRNRALQFRLVHAAMPENGTPAEAFRVLWHLDVDGVEYRLTMKSGDIGKPDAVAQTGTERTGEISTEGHFRLERCSEGDDVGTVTLVNCTAVEYLGGAFDPTTRSVTTQVPLRAIKARAGSVVSQGSGGAADTCPVCWVSHFAERSLTPATVIDSAVMSRRYVVPVQ